MGGPKAALSAQEGAGTAIWLATRNFDLAGVTQQEKSTGLLWEKMQVVDW
jgi:hypothetical protein